MAGPTANVLLSTATNVDTARDILLERYNTVADTEPIESSGNCELIFDGWIHERPFSISLGEDFEGELDEDYSNSDFLEKTGWKPVERIGIVAMCNDKEDHLLLAQIASDLIDGLGGGFCDMDGIPSFYIQGPKKEVGELTTLAAELDGEWFILTSHSSPEDGESFGKNETWQSICVDAAFLRSWMKHENFRMVK